MSADRRLLLVHAHPDDESIGTGATMARYAAEGAQVTLLTCTLGEEGEILVPSLAGLAADQADQLGGYRIGELAAAMRALGVTDHRFLGGAGRFRDSGMIGTVANAHARAFWRAGTDPARFGEAVGAAVAVIREVRPHVMVTYDPNGDYGHPDHIMAHRVATAAVQCAADPGYRPDAGSVVTRAGRDDPWRVSKCYWTATPRSGIRDSAADLAAGHERFRAAVGSDLESGVPDDQVTTVIDASAYRDAKARALSAHRTQVIVDGPHYALSNLVGRRLTGVEHFRLAVGALGPHRDASGHETDLFDGVC